MIREPRAYLQQVGWGWCAAVADGEPAVGQIGRAGIPAAALLEGAQVESALDALGMEAVPLLGSGRGRDGEVTCDPVEQVVSPAMRWTDESHFPTSLLAGC